MTLCVGLQDMLISLWRWSGHFVFWTVLLLCLMLLLVLRLVTAFPCFSITCRPFLIDLLFYLYLPVLNTPASLALNLVTGADSDCVATSREAPCALYLFP